MRTAIRCLIVLILTLPFAPLPLHAQASTASVRQPGHAARVLHPPSSSARGGKMQTSLR